MQTEKADETYEWPEEIWAGAMDEFEPVGNYVCSEFATVSRWEGDKERDRAFHRYIDGDIHESAERYFRHQLEAERDRAARLDTALRAKDSAMQELFRRLDAAGVDTSDLIP